MRCLLALLLSVLLIFTGLNAQVDTIIICDSREPVQLDVMPGAHAYQWSPAATVSDPTIANPVATPYDNTTYIAEIIPNRTSDNLIFNADFSAGNQGFTSDYDFFDRIVVQGAYGVDKNAKILNPIFFEDCPDRHSPDGLLMVVDGSPIADEKVWCQTVGVQPVRDYAFSAWVASVNPLNPPALNFSINGNTIGDIFYAEKEICGWRQFYTTWNADTATTAEICIVNQNTRPDGNDFVLDDFAFFELEKILYDTTVVLVQSLNAAAFRQVYFPNVFTPNFDGQNDTFQPFYNKGIRHIQRFSVYDRWGNQVFHTENCPAHERDCGWDGRFQGEWLNSGIYLYVAEIKYADGLVEKYTGEVKLLR